MSQISPQLWIGSYENINSSQFLNERGITHMLSCAPELAWQPGHVLYNDKWYHIRITDSSAVGIFQDAAKKIDEWIQAGHTVIVYCYQGTNQSVSAVIAYLILYKGWSFMLALSHVMRLRNGAAPNQDHISLMETITRSDPSKTLANSPE